MHYGTAYKNRGAKKARLLTSARVLTCALALTCITLAPASAQSPLIDASVSHPSRPEADTLRDKGRKPGEVMRFFNVEEGAHVIEFGAGGGYYTELLSRAVGDEGSVYAYNPFIFLRFVHEEINDRYSETQLPNVTLTFASVANLNLPSEQFDAAYFINTYHDIYYNESTGENMSPQAVGTLKEVYKSLKPGGVVGIIDHRADDGSSRSDAAGLHRMIEELLRKDFESAGFEYVGSSDLLSHKSDPQEKAWFQDPDLKDVTERMVVRFRKPM